MSDPPVHVRTYRGRTQAEARARLAEDEASMTAAGYLPSSPAWAERIEYGAASKLSFAIAAICTAGGWVTAWPLSVVGMVFLVVGMVMRTGTGELTVTWTREGAAELS